MANELVSLAAGLIRSWSTSGISVRGGATPRTFAQLKQDSAQFPQEFTQFYQTVDGMERHDYDELAIVVPVASVCVRSVWNPCVNLRRESLSWTPVVNPRRDPTPAAQ
jgi:hypothetical protein